MNRALTAIGIALGAIVASFMVSIISLSAVDYWLILGLLIAFCLAGIAAYCILRF